MLLKETWVKDKMKTCNKKAINKLESKINVVKKRSDIIMIYNPECSDFEQSSLEAFYAIALPDNRMDQKLTEKIGKKFVLI